MINQTSNMNSFFSYLASRGNENYLSDIIAAACNSCFTIKKIFLEFIFPDENIMGKCPSEIEREFSDDNGKYRFDFYFTTNDGTEYIIENKIYDKNDHYKDYSGLNSEHIGFIANYDVSTIKYKYKHTWKDFYLHLRKKCYFSENDIPLIEGITYYIKEACGIMEDRNFNLSDLNDLGYIIQKLKEIMKEKGYEINNKAKGCTENRIGFWGYKEPRSYWFGIYLDINKTEGFAVWGGIYNYKIEQKNLKLSYSEYHSEYDNDSSNWFKLKKEFLYILQNEDVSINEKTRIIKDFINEIELIK